MSLALSLHTTAIAFSMFSTIISQDLKVVASDNEVYMENNDGYGVILSPDEFIRIMMIEHRVRYNLQTSSNDLLYFGDDSYIRISPYKVEIFISESKITLNIVEWDGLVKIAPQIMQNITI